MGWPISIEISRISRIILVASSTKVHSSPNIIKRRKWIASYTSLLKSADFRISRTIATVFTPVGMLNNFIVPIFFELSSPVRSWSREAFNIFEIDFARVRSRMLNFVVAAVLIIIHNDAPEGISLNDFLYSA